MTPNSLLFSFAKFIELKFYCDSYRARSDVSVAEEGVAEGGGANHCPHSLHRDYTHWFIYRNRLASFRYMNSPLLITVYKSYKLAYQCASAAVLTALL